MIPLGKTHMVEFAFGGWGRNQPMGTPWNPWDTAHAPRAGRVVERLGGRRRRRARAGGDRLRHRRLGAHPRGAVRAHRAQDHLRPHQPRPRVPLSTTLDSIGPLARSVDDAALLTAAMAGRRSARSGHARRAARSTSPRRSPARGLRGMRIGARAGTVSPPSIDRDVLGVLARHRRRRCAIWARSSRRRAARSTSTS